MATFVEQATLFANPEKFVNSIIWYDNKNKFLFQRVHIKFCFNIVVGINVIKCVQFFKVMTTISEHQKTTLKYYYVLLPINPPLILVCPLQVRCHHRRQGNEHTFPGSRDFKFFNTLNSLREFLFELYKYEKPCFTPDPFLFKPLQKCQEVHRILKEKLITIVWFFSKQITPVSIYRNASSRNVRITSIV